MPWPAAVGGVVVAVVGTAGLLRGAMPVSVPALASEPIVVSNAYVRPPAPPNDSAAGYFTVQNNTDRADRLVSVISGAGATAVLHTSGMTVNAVAAVVPAHGRLVLSTGHGHVMIEKLYGTLRPGQSVNLTLTFQRAGAVSVAARVIALGGAVPTGGSS